MKITLQYVSDSSGKTQSVQLPLTDWERLLTRLNRYERRLKIKTDLTEAFQQVARLRTYKAKNAILN